MWPVVAIAAIGFVLWRYHSAQWNLHAYPVGDTQRSAQSQPPRAPGSQIPFERGPDVLPDCIPHLRKTHDFIPSSGFDAMTRIGNVNQPELLLDYALFDNYRMAPIPQPEVAPQRVPALPPEHMSHFEHESVMPGEGFFYEH